MAEAGKTWSFSDFISKCIIDNYDNGGVTGMNEHFRPQAVIGSFCSINYNFIGKSGV